MPAEHRALLEKRIAELKARIGEGGLREAAIRGLLYAGSARGMVDERSLEGLRSLRRHDRNARITLPEFKMLVREQFFMLLLDQEAALAAIPELLPENANERRVAFAAIREAVAEAPNSRRGREAPKPYCRVVQRGRGGGFEYCPFRSQGEGVVRQV